MATSAIPKPVSPMTKLATNTTTAPAAQAAVIRAIIPGQWPASVATVLQSRPGDGGGAMLMLGYKLSSEEFSPNDLVRYGAMAEQSGFEFALISDHFHPWTDAQGQSPFVWSVIGA